MKFFIYKISGVSIDFALDLINYTKSKNSIANISFNFEKKKDDMLKGEWCFMVSLPKEKEAHNTTFIKQACELGLTQSQIGALAKTLGWNKKDVYNDVLKHKKN